MRALVAVALLLCGCTKNHAELRSRLADADRQLAAQQAAAQRLNDDRRALDQAEDELVRALAEFPEGKPTLEEAPLPPPVKPTFAPLPPESAFEGAEGARLRRQIEETQRRITELARVLGEVEKINARRRHIERQLAQLRQRQAPPK